MAGMIPADASLPPCPMDVTFALQEDGTSAALSSLESDNFVFVQNTHPNKILEGLNNLRLKNEFCDVILCCGGQEFSCHRNVLASFSPYFEAMFTTEWMESQQMRVPINGVEPQMIGMMVNYAYTSKVLISTANVQALLAASNLLNVTAVKLACCHYMERHMDEKNCVGIHCFAEAHSCKRLEKRSMDYILEHFSVVYQQEEFLSLSEDKLTEILSNDDLNVLEEEMVFDAAIWWSNKCPTRRQSFEKILEHIRLPLIGPSYLDNVTEWVDVVKESQGCQRLISEAKKQHLLPYSHKAQPRRVSVIVLVAGLDHNMCTLHSVDSFDPLTNQWKTLACLPMDIQEYGLAASDSLINPTLYLAGGEFPDGTVSRKMWRYDPSHDSWLEMASMHAARSRFGLVMLDGYVYAVGGWDVHTSVTSLERYNPTTDTWRLLASPCMPEYFAGSVVVALGLIYLIDDGVPTEPGRVYNYNPNTWVWTEVAPVLVRRKRSAVCTLKGKIYVIGGQELTQELVFTAKVECYDPKTNQWSMRSPMKKRRSEAGVAVVHGKIYVLGGVEERRRYLHCIERYCEDTDTWEIVGEMPTGRMSLGCECLRMKKDAHPATADSTPVNTWEDDRQIF